MSSPRLSVLFRSEEESWNAFLRRIRETEGEVIVVLSRADNSALLDEEARKLFLGELAKIRYRVKLASKEPVVIHDARKAGMTVYTKTRMLRSVLSGHPKVTDALRFFSPSLWRQHWRSRLQSLGLLSLPRVRIWILITLSAFLFFFVIFELLPSAEVRIWPRRDVVTHTMNVVLVLSGADVTFPSHLRTMPLLPVTVRSKKLITFKDISPEFIGTDANMTVLITNRTAEAVALRQGTRLMNQAGMVFRLRDGVEVPAKGSTSARTVADHEDLYGKIMGDRGNVPAGVQWTFPGLSEEERKLVTAENKTAAAGGRTAYRSVLQQKDLDLAKKRLEQELLAAAKQAMMEERLRQNTLSHKSELEFLNKGDLIRTTYSGFIIPVDLIGKEVPSVVLEGSIIYTVPAYDAAAILQKFGSELQAHTGDGKQLTPESVHLDPDRVVVIEYADNLAWIKITLDTVGTEEYALDPFTPSGARFAKRAREAIAGLSKKEAERILRNFPEVERAEVHLWPPWGSSVPSIQSNISLDPQ